MIGGSEFNARSLPASEIPEWFVPPESHFLPLTTRDHTVMLGPRGSGKTTLLKMLTIKALNNWTASESKEYIPKIRFNAAMVPGDRLWGRQIADIERDHPGIGEAIFVAHTIRALLRAMKDVIEVSEHGLRSELTHLKANMEPAKEKQFSEIASKAIRINISLNSVAGLIFELDSILANIDELKENRQFRYENLTGMINAVVSAFNELSTAPTDRRWALLFDELEIAPEKIQTLLMSIIRSGEQRVVYKLAFAPFSPLVLDESPAGPKRTHDYGVIPLTYANKEDARTFIYQIAERLFLHHVNKLDDIKRILGNSSYRVNHKTGNRMPDEFISLQNKDESFASYIKKNSVYRKNKLNENEKAQYIRKIAPIVKARDYYLSSYTNNRARRERSRKAHTLYHGYPTLLEAADGNPRALLTMLVPMAQTLMFEKPEGISKPITRVLQSEAIRRAESLLVSLLNVIPAEVEGDNKKGLLGFVDRIGRRFEGRLLSGPFKPDLLTTFVVDDGVSDAEKFAVGQALNVGAIIHVPYLDANPDGILRGIEGMKFRLSYALAPRYRLPLTLGDTVNLSSLLSPSAGVESDQLSFFQED